MHIYIHIPFCIKKCNYCSFLSFSCSEEERERYVSALIEEIKGCKDRFAYTPNISTVYLGGGTPSVLKAEQLGHIMSAVRESFDISENAEITIEANPGTVGNTDEDVRKTLHQYREYGFNRLSMGVQSLNNDVLKFIGRIHTAEDVKRDFRIAREEGWDNINLDLILSLPINNSREQSLADLKELIDMHPEHISCYSLQIEEGTPFGRLYDEGKLNEVSDEEDRETYHKVCALLTAAGYEHYEISNFAYAGEDAGEFGSAERAHSPYRSRHNSSYWNMSDYIGLGLGASGFVNGVRYRNTCDMQQYLVFFSGGSPGVIAPESYDEYHRNTAHDNISEAVFTGLRRIEGIRYEDAVRYIASENIDAALSTKERFWQYYSDVREEADRYVASGHLIIDDEGMRLTESGIDISNSIMALFV